MLLSSNCEIFGFEGSSNWSFPQPILLYHRRAL